MVVSLRELESWALEALDSLPAPFQLHRDSVVVRAEDQPSRALLAELGVGPEEAPYGLYEGENLLERDPALPSLPSCITLFRRPLLEDFPDPGELRDEVARTVLHEFGHHLGLEEERLEELGWD